MNYNSFCGTFRHSLMITIAMVLMIGGTPARSEDSDEVSILEEVKLLKLEIESLKKENEQIRADIDQLKKGGSQPKTPKVAKTKEKEKPKLWTDSIVKGTILPGNYKQIPPLTGYGDYLITITERDGRKIKADYLITPKGGEPRTFPGKYEGTIGKDGIVLRSVGQADQTQVEIQRVGDELAGSFESASGIKATCRFEFKE